MEVVEYAVIAGLIVVATISALTILGVWALKQYGIANDKLGEGSP